MDEKTDDDGKTDHHHSEGRKVAAATHDADPSRGSSVKATPTSPFVFALLAQAAHAKDPKDVLRPFPRCTPHACS